MKKITLIFGLFLTLFASAQKTERVAFNKAAYKEFEDYEQKTQLYLSSGEFKLTYVKYDTVYSAKHGHPQRDITATTTVIIIRAGEKGQIVEWVGDTLWVKFDTRDKMGLKLPFVPSASGSGNSSNNLILKTDVARQINGDPIPGSSSKKITLGEGDDRLTYTFEGDKPHLEYEPIRKNFHEKTQIRSRGVKVK